MAIKLDGQDRTIRLLKQFETQLGKGIEDGIKQLGQSSARALAMKVQPYGLSQQRGEKYIKNIRLQVSQVYVGVNIGEYSDSGGMEASHRSQRRNGSIKGERFDRKGKKWSFKINEGQKEALVRRQQKKAGRAKAAWIDCGVKLGLKMSGVGQWIKRHVGQGYGNIKIIGKGLKSQIEMHNEVKYLTGPQKDKDVRNALKMGRTNGLKRMKMEIYKSIKKYGIR